MFSNIVKKNALRKVQSETLNTLKEALIKSFGPYGSNTIINKHGALPRYTKDGHTILSSIQFSGEIENCVKTDIEEETRTQAQKIGDSTTSITILSSLIFDALAKYEADHNEYAPRDIINDFKIVSEKIIEKIKSKARPITLKDIYDITYISSNGNKKLAEMLRSVYEEFGFDVYIDVKASMNGTTYLKEINGMTLDCGFLDPTLINDTVKNTCNIKNPKIFAFKDPIDTPEMGMFMDMILVKNLVNPLKDGKVDEIHPVVIMAPRLSRDYSAYIESLMSYFAQIQASNRGLLNIITDVAGVDMEQFEDICDLCGCKYIKKYIDPEIQKEDIKKGLAPTKDNIDSFAGTAELVTSDVHKTTFVNPKKMYNKDGSPSELFNQRTDYLQKQIDKLNVEGNTTTEIYSLKKRLNSLKGKMVEIYIGGVTVADRDAERDLMEDAVLNCRSAALNGVGYAANFEGLRASIEVFDSLDGRQKEIAEIIHNAYGSISTLLYSTVLDYPIAEAITERSLAVEMPFNLDIEKFDDAVVTSIDTDICTIDTISKIITIMATANQFIMTSINMNNY